MKISGVLCFIIIFFISVYAADTGKKSEIEIFFTSPGTVKPGKIKTPESGLVKIIDSSKKKIIGAFFDISSKKIVNSLIKAKRRNLEVRIVTDTDNYDRKGVEKLIDSGIEVVTDHRGAFMHNKFAVFDEKTVWTGSYNITENGNLRNNNNALKINSTSLAYEYTCEFEEMFYSRIFGNREEKGPFKEFIKKYLKFSKWFHLNKSETEVYCYFSPEDDVEKIMVNNLKKASKSIHFMAFSFTSDMIGETIINMFHQGVAVCGIFEKRGSGTIHSEYTKMKIEGIPVKKDRNRNVMHHKVIIIDGKIVITGSYNFSKNASLHNDENIIIMHNRLVAGKYLREFFRLY